MSKQEKTSQPKPAKREPSTGKPARRAAPPPRRKPTGSPAYVQQPLFDLDQGGAR
jgi:hypothetical protein